MHLAATADGVPLQGHTIIRLHHVLGVHPGRSSTPWYGGRLVAVRVSKGGGQPLPVVFPHRDIQGEQRLLKGMHLPAFEGPRGQVIRVDLFHHAVDDRELGQVVVSGAAVIADVLCSEKQEDQMGGEKGKMSQGDRKEVLIVSCLGTANYSLR